MCVFFFVSCYSITYQNNVSISNFGGSFRWKNEYLSCIIEVKTQKEEFSSGFQKTKKK
ncbi:Uncharacterized protein FWK35_00027056 [Aphis craccivora]|uniref:Uncharacterized protein n=1 Tax=Aphis craccivora TaxID=307492 RepID=A0A6G0Y8L8_APHCR|nr:Uncharacterized protein FWK35_00027056 [Aphis craccivora]